VGAGGLLLVSAIDGRLYALDKTDGAVLWTADTGGRLVSAYQNESVFSDSLIVPSLTGDIFIYRRQAIRERAREREKTERERAQERNRARETELCNGDDVSYL
jgi:glucose dehydrogenase